MTSDLERALATLIKMEGLPPPEREFRFHPRRRWRLDLAWPQRQIAVEVEGGSWVNGAHTRGAHFRSDCEKYSEAAVAGWCVIRVTGDMIEDGSAIDLIKRALCVREGARL